jgi:hypothetical protein
MNTEKIEKLKRGLNNSHINDELKSKIQAEINRLEKEDEKNAVIEEKPKAVRKQSVRKASKENKSVEPTPAPKAKNTVLSKAKEIRKEGESWKDAQKRASEMIKKESKEDKELTKSEMKELLALINKNKELKKLVGDKNISRDAKRVALPAGKRISKDGDTYYENRLNRTDRIKAGKLSLAKGGKTSRVWTDEQVEKAEQLDYDFENAVKEKGIERNSKDASDLWRSGGFQERMAKIFGRTYEKHESGAYLTNPTFGQFQNIVYANGGEIEVYKGFHGLQAENYIDNVNGFDWNIVTMKRHTGNLVSSATAGQSKKGNDGVVEIFTHDWDAPKINLITSKPSRVTEKVIAEQHKNALEIFKEKMTGKFEQGGNFDKPFNVIYKTKSGRGMVASNIMAKNEKEAEEKLKKQMRASSTFDSVIMVHESFEVGGILSSKERYVLEVKGQTGLSVGAIEKYIDDNNLSEGELLNIVVGLGRKQLKGADVATAVVGKPNNAISKEIIAFAKSDKAMKLELGGNLGAYDLAGHLNGTLNVGQNDGNLSGTTGTYYTGLVGETGTMSSGEMFELGGGVPSGLQGAVQSYTNAYANEGATAGMYEKGGKFSKKYVPHYEIESVTVKKGKKQIVIKGSDVLNGANMLKKGGDLSKSATYFPKRDVVSVKLKNGEVVHPANGYWVGITPKMVRTQFEESAFEYAVGGEIENQYEGKTPEQIWNMFTQTQKAHFLHDHKDQIDSTPRSLEILSGKAYKFLPADVKKAFRRHVETGQYEDGGFTNKDGIKVRSVAKPEKELSEKEWMEKHSESNEARAYASGGEIRVGDKVKVKASGIGEDYVIVEGFDSPKQVLTKNDNPNTYLAVRDNEGYAWEIYLKEVVEFPSNTYEKGGKVTFAQKAKAIAKNFEGKQVEPKHQKEYGKTYNKAEAKEVGDKIAGAMKAKSKMSKGGEVEKSIKFYEGDYQKLVIDSSKEHPFYSVQTGVNWSIFKEKDEKKVGSWNSKTNVLKLSNDSDLIDWLEENNYSVKKMKSGGKLTNHKGNSKMNEAVAIAKKIRKDGEAWASALKRAWAQVK